MVGGDPKTMAQSSVTVQKQIALELKRYPKEFIVLICIMSYICIQITHFYNVLGEGFKNAIFYQEPDILHISLLHFQEK